MARARGSKRRPDLSDQVAFLLSQVGSHASGRFAERLEPLGLKPPHVGILAVIRHADGLSQQALCENLGVFPSRLVGLLDELEARGVVERRPSPSDRRSHALYLTEAGRAMLEQIDRLVKAHQETLCAALTGAERSQLARLLARIAAEQGLRPGIHPGFRKLACPESG
jgi:DNA-binding MarR family transcriptional regulator